MEFFLSLLPFLVPLTLFGVFIASLHTGWEILREGNAADPLGREIETENREEEKKKAA